MTCGVYEIVNNVNGKRYVGSSNRIEHRWSQHKSRLNNGSHHSLHLQRAWDKYGSDNFVFNIIAECSQDNLIPNEQSEIDSGCQYNISPTAGRTAGLEVSDSAKEKMSESAYKKWGDPGYRDKMSAIRKDIWSCPDRRMIISRSSKRNWENEEFRSRMSKVNSGENNPKFDHTIYNFTHDEFGDISCTKYHLYKNYGLNPNSIRLVCKGDRQSHAGWRIKKGPN